jgi:hypothetical protein
LNVSEDLLLHIKGAAGAKNSVDAFDGVLAVAIEAKIKTDAG